MSIDRGSIADQLQAIGEDTRWWDKREMRDLPDVLHAGERILAISSGKIARVRWLRRPWLIVVTDRRLLCLRSNSRTGWRQLEVAAGQIARVSLRVGPFRGRVRVQTGNETTWRLLVPRPDAWKLEGALAGLVLPGKHVPGGFGPVRMVHRVIDHVLALPAAALNPDEIRAAAPVPPDNTQNDARLEVLEAEIHELRQQVDFLENLLRQRHAPLEQERISS